MGPGFGPLEGYGAFRRAQLRRAQPLMLRGRAPVRMDGTPERRRDVWGRGVLCPLQTRSLPRLESAQQIGLRFRAVLTEGDTNRLELRML